MKHKVSIIMPVLNGERYISTALESIVAQTFKNHELIVVNDGSTDRTAEIVDSFAGKLNIKCVCHPARKGIAVSVNDGLRTSSGDFITFLDHDDMWLPDALATQVSYLDQHPDVGMVYCDFQTIDPQGSVIEESVAQCRERQRPSGDVFQKLFLDSFIAAIGALIRKECFDRLGGFDETLLWGDYHMWLRIARHYRIDYVPKVLAMYRQHDSQSTRSLPVLRREEDPVALAAIKSIVNLYPEIRQELGEKTIRQRMASIYFGGAYYWFDAGAYPNARIHLIKAMSIWPSNPRYYLMYLATLLRPSQIEAVRRVRRRLQSGCSAKKQRSGQWQGGRIASTVSDNRR